MNFNRRSVVRLDTLPAAISIDMTAVPPLDCLQVDLVKLGTDEPLCILFVSEHSQCRIKVSLDSALAKHGAGRYQVRVFDDCTLCDTLEVELVRDCRIVDSTAHRATLNQDCCA